MRLPFGLDFKTAIVTVLFMYFVLPFILTWIGGMRKGANTKAE